MKNDFKPMFDNILLTTLILHPLCVVSAFIAADAVTLFVETVALNKTLGLTNYIWYGIIWV